MKSHDNPLVSIVIPAYNAGDFIDRTLASAVAQTYRNIEIIVVDDGSTDDTALHVERWAQQDPRITLITQTNGGVARARNRGIDDAGGELIAFLDADDLWHREKIRLQVECITESPVPLGGCYALTRSIDADDNVIMDGPRLIASGYVLGRHLCTHLVRNGSCLMVRREVAVSLGGFDPSYASRGLGGCEDIDFELKLAAKCLIGAVPYYLVGYRQYPGNMSSNRIRMANALRATVSAHLAANPGLPRKIRRHAWAKIYEYHIWNNVPERRFGTSILASFNLALLDLPLAIHVGRALCHRAALYFGLIRVKMTSPVAFLDLPMDPIVGFTNPRDIRLLDELSHVDAALLSQLKPHCIEAA